MTAAPVFLLPVRDRSLVYCGIEVSDYAETFMLQMVIRDHGTPSAETKAPGSDSRGEVVHRNHADNLINVIYSSK